MRPSQIAFALILIGMLRAGPAHPVAFDLKTGLWEHSVTTVTELSRAGNHDLSKLPPDERAKIEQAMSGTVTMGRPARVTQECVTPAMLEKWSAFAHSEIDSAKCKRAIVDESSKHMKATLSCDGGKTKGTIDFTATGEQLKGSVVMVTQEQDFNRTVKQQITGKWLGAQCSGSQTSKSPQ